MKKVAILVAGCGFKDGAEITEVISSWIALKEGGAQVSAFSLNLEVPAQSHLSQGPLEKRSLVEEAARIFRGDVKDLHQLKTDVFDALVIPGGFGVALHFCNWAEKGSQCDVHPEVRRVMEQFYEQQKPIGAWCIAPVLLARLFGKDQPVLTIGNDLATAEEIKKTGAHHENCPVGDFVSDRAHRFVTTPAFMYGGAGPHEVFAGIGKACKEVVEMA